MEQMFRATLNMFRIQEGLDAQNNRILRMPGLQLDSMVKSLLC